MAEQTGIEWTGSTWNPVTGCDKVSPGCAHCYAETFAERWRGIPGHPYEQGFDLKLWPERLERPLKWRRPRMIFVNSMSDLFHERVPDDYIAQVFAVMAAAQRHTFQVLTKRPERMRQLVTRAFHERVGRLAWELCERLDLTLSYQFPLPNVWLGTSIENRRFVHRADDLRATPAAVRFVSAEPLLGPLIPPIVNGRAEPWPDTGSYLPPYLDLFDIDWLIAGGESGPGARRCDFEWIRALRDACAATRTAFFLKQLGGHPDKRGGDKAVLDGRTWHQMPERPVGVPA